MASVAEVKSYLAHWFQLGKKLVWRNGVAEIIPEKVLQGSHYAPEFEACWAKVMSIEGRDCYLVNEDVTIQELLSDEWVIEQCARCKMPVPLVEVGSTFLDCTCSDLDNWPNFELPKPHAPVNTQARLVRICQHLQAH
ncbi:MAG: hypothetical protein AAFQ80_14470 [Cyanobacteria bacterium J06621_8]